MGKPSIDSRQRDVELILRFFALVLDRKDYEKPMKDFLSKFMKANRDPEDTSPLETLFMNTSAAVKTTLGDRPFHIRKGLNSAVFDCIMVSFARHLDAIPKDIGSRWQQLTADANFLAKVSSNTTDVEVVTERMRLADEKLFG
jgi:hypothetical protein